MSTAQNIIDHNDFSTETGYLKPGESDFRSEICLNGTWDFQPVSLPEGFTSGESIPELPLPQPDQWESVKLKVPSPWNINGFVDGDGVPGSDFNCYPSYPESWKYVKMAWMRRLLRVPEDWADKSILLHFEAVCGYCEVYIDGQKVGEHFDNSMPRTYPLDAFVTPGKDYEVWVGVRAPELMNVSSGPTKYTYPTGSFFNMKTTGIWQDVTLLGVPKIRIKDIYVQPDVSADQLRIQVTVENRSGQAASLKVDGVVKALKPFLIPDDGIQVVPHHDLEDQSAIELPGGKVTVAADTEVVFLLKATVSGQLLKWDTDNPNLYASLVTLEQDGQAVDRKYTRFGWREFKIKDGDFYLNNRRIRIKGDSWHFMGIPQLTRRYAFAWYRALQDAGGNGVRLHAMPYPTFYLEVADEMGVCVLDESAIWASHTQFNHDEPVTWERFYEHVESLILRDRNFPSVMGWSVENEIRMALAPRMPSEETKLAVREKACKLLDIAQALDPTRDWVSADGSGDWDGRFPTSIIHYGRPHSYQEIRRMTAKPVGVGEGTIAYFGTPKQASVFAGDRAFQSAEDRMAGVAIESYADLKAQFSADFDYMSVFNLVWYGLKPLPLGHIKQEQPPAVENGIVFGEYQEGKPGVQPERLGPYCTTLNPGYDPNLPLYDPWPSYDAIKAVFQPGGPHPSSYEAVIETSRQKAVPTLGQPELVIFMGDTDSDLYQGLCKAGIQLSDDKHSAFVIADLSTVSTAQETLLKNGIDALKSSGGTVMLTGLTPAAERLLETLTGENIQLFEREASSLVFAGEYADTDPLVDHFRLEELYFSEEDDYVVMRYGIQVENLPHTKALLKACGCDWRMWNRRSETSKTGALFRSEKEQLDANALVQLELGEARILLCTLDMVGKPSAHKLRLSPNRKYLWYKLLKAAGAAMDDELGGKRYSTYSPIGQLLANEQVKDTLAGYLPSVAVLDDATMAEIGKASLREVAVMYAAYVGLSNDQLDAIDDLLSTISMQSDESTAALAGETIIRVLTVGRFAGQDCASMLEQDYLNGENSVAPTQADPNAWQVVNAGNGGFCFAEMALEGPKEYSTSYMSFYLKSPRDLEDLLCEPNVPDLYLSIETACCIRVWLDGKEIFTKADISAVPVKSQPRLLLRQGSNHILIKVVNTDTDYVVKVHLASTHRDYIGKLVGSVER